ncbi:hypothetical protein BH10BDE1_BH10BDE1_14980 [soil metagenome]
MIFKVIPLAISLTIFSALSFTSVPSRAAVWENTAEWNDASESQYRQWVSQNWNKDYFNQAGPMKGSMMDCADVVYSMRAIFASQNGLPFAMKDPTTRAGTIISNSMTRWDSKSQDQRVRSFIQLIFGVGSTASLPADTYPTAIGPMTLGAGSMIVTDKANHHSWTIQHFSQTGIPYLLFGSRPARTLLYERNEYPTVGFVFPQGIRAETNGGFRNFRQPADVGKPVYDVPGYSLEQYSFPAATFMKTVQKRMQNIEETGEQHVLRVYNEACKGSRERVEIVRGAIQKQGEIGARCMNATEYDDQSTPSRDSRLKDSFKDLAAAYKDALNNRSITAGTRKLVESVLSGASSVSNTNAACLVEISPGTKLTLGQIFAFSVGDKLSNNPHDTLQMRWGLQAGPSAKAKSCPVY